MAASVSVAEQERGGPVAKFGALTIEQGWARVASRGPRTGAVYLTVHNTSDMDDYLLAVESPEAQTSMIHEAAQEPVPGGLTLPSHEEVIMRPDGFHILLGNISDAVKPGGVLALRIVLREAGIFDIEIPVIGPNDPDPAVRHTGH